MNERGCIYLRNSSTCGLLDKDDHTYSCDRLMMNDQCPLQTSDPLGALAMQTMAPFIKKMMKVVQKC